MSGDFIPQHACTRIFIYPGPRMQIKACRECANDIAAQVHVRKTAAHPRAGPTRKDLS
jgi:hypothetical protein